QYLHSFPTRRSSDLNFSVPSMAGSVVWYHRDFKLPSSDARYSWLLRFESIRYRASIWLNGHRVGGHAGAYIPFEVDLAKGLSRRSEEHTSELQSRFD